MQKHINHIIPNPGATNDSNPLIHLIIRLAVVITALFPLSERAEAQEDYRFEIGGGLGMTGYLGDACTSNLYANPGWDLEAAFRYLQSPRIAFKTQAFVGSLRGNTAKLTDYLPAPESRNYKFSTTFFQLAEMFEFNFVNFGMGESYRHLKRLSPYITGGLGLSIWTTSGYTGAAFTIPFGVGVKYKLQERLNLGVEFLMAKAFNDRLDGPVLADPHGIKSSFLKNTDWYSTLSVTLTYEFSKRCAVCNYKD